MQELTSIITFEPREDNGELERAIQKFINAYGYDPTEGKHEQEERFNKIDEIS